MKHVEIHSHYLRQLVHEHVVSIEYCRTDDQDAHIFIKPLIEARFINIYMMLGLQEATIMGWCHNDVISPPESPELCIYGGRGGALEHQALMVHHTSPGFNYSRGRPTYGYSRMDN
jgi:hypothetical protein